MHVWEGQQAARHNIITELSEEHHRSIFAMNVAYGILDDVGKRRMIGRKSRCCEERHFFRRNPLS